MGKRKMVNDKCNIENENSKMENDKWKQKMNK